MNKKIAGFTIVMACCIVVVACLCSFAPPTIGWTVYNVSGLTETDVENIMAVVDFQAQYGSFNSFIPVACHLSNSTVRLYLVPSNANWTFTEASGSYTLSTGANNIMRTTLAREGFGMYYTGSTATIPEEHLLFYRSGDGTFVKGEAFNYATGVDDDVIADCAATWFETWNVVNGYETAIEEAESVGFDSGYDVGYADGLDQGFADGLEEGESRGYESGLNDGYDSGFNVGVQAGYNSGLNDGYDSGFDDGYEEGESEGYNQGYNEGYTDGYDTGRAEGGGSQTPAPSYNLDIPAIFDGMFAGVGNVLSAFDIELFGINVVGVLLSLLVIAIVAFIVRRLMK